ncbi:hypothetical protein LguiB_006256 [Lonicera macranthoides]
MAGPEIAVAVFAGATLLLKSYEKLKGESESKKGTEILPTLGNAIRELCALRDDREHIYRAYRKTMERSNSYRTWLEEVNNMEVHANDLIEKHEKRIPQPTNKFKLGFEKLGKKMKGEKMKAEKLGEKMKAEKMKAEKLGEKMEAATFEALRLYKQVIDVLLIKSGPPPVVEMKAQSIKEYPTLQNCLNLILHHLQDDRVKGIRVHGMFGVGKTVIMQNLNNHGDVASMFELVIWVTVADNSQNFSIRKMQKDIATRLKLNMEDGGDPAGRIREELEGMKYLLLLDDVNEDLDLEEIGIPPPSDKNGSKIVLTSRKSRVCNSIVNRSVEVKRLSNQEAQAMFRKVLGDSRTWPVVQQVIEYCSRLPFLIQTIGSAFQNRETEELWASGLNNLRLFPDRGDHAIRKAYKYLELCCEELRGHKKDCFLFTAIFPEVSEINARCLLDCWAAEELYGTDQERAYGRHILDELKTASLLEEGTSGRGEYVRMHKLIRKVALDKLFADSERTHLVRTGELLQDPPGVDDLNQKYRISLADNNLGVLQECPNSPSLFTLFLQKNQRLNSIHSDFFRKLNNLRVLNLQNTGIVSIPSSLLRLKNLKVFYVNDCTSLEILPPKIGELGSLEILDIRGTRVQILDESFLHRQISRVVDIFTPKLIFGGPSSVPLAPFPETNRLRHLKRLLVSFSDNGSQDAEGFCQAISNISTTLEELVIDVNSIQNLCNTTINVVRDGVATMTRLTFLKFIFRDGAEEVIKVVAGNKKIYFPEAGDLTRFLNPGSDSFDFYVGCSISAHQIPEMNQYQKHLKVCNTQRSNFPTPNITALLPSCNAFELVNDNGLERLSHFETVETAETAETASLDGIQGCLIEGCNRIGTIANGGDPALLARPMLPGLLELYMKNLPLLTSIWTGPWKAGSLVNLETLLIEDCIEIRELLTDSTITSNLLHLRKLILANLQKLQTICASQGSNWPALEELRIDGCPRLSELPFQQVNANNLKKLILVNLPTLKNFTNVVIWPDLEELQMDGCLDISTLPLSKHSATRLRKLILISMPNLTTLSTDASLVSPMLEEFEIRGCPNLTCLTFHQISVTNLRYIKASQRWWDALTWEDPKVKDVVQNLFRPL